MVKSGAFDSLGIERNQALANMDDILKFANAMKRGGGIADRIALRRRALRANPEVETGDAGDDRPKN